jgi:transcriptional regulator with PAS, ATPase and Fis domain
MLDEIADLPAGVQAKLLRALDPGEIIRIGASVPTRVDVRIIAATQEPLQSFVSDGRFREDLFARLSGVTIEMPLLKDRREDVPYLVKWLVHKHGGGKTPVLDSQLVERLCLYDWPLNVRELVRTVQSLLAIHGSEPVLKKHHLPQQLHADAGNATGPAPAPAGSTRDDRELAALLDALRTHRGNVAAAARAVGISRPRANRLLNAADIDADRYRDATLAPRGGR